MMDYEKLLNKKLLDIKPSGIRKFFDLAEKMENVISLGVGEPDFLTPWHIRQEAVKSLDRGKTRYTANAGLINLRKEIASFSKKKNSLGVLLKENLISSTISSNIEFNKIIYA